MEELKKLRCIHLADKRDNEKLCNVIEEVKFLNAIINMMAKDISNTDMFPWENINSEKVREYYFKKARGEENVKN